MQSTCRQIATCLYQVPIVQGFVERDGLFFFEGDRLVVLNDPELREALLHDSHDALGHFGAKKSLAALSQSLYWAGMAKQVEEYVASCDGCQRHKARTTRRTGKLHPLPIPPRPFANVALDFVGPLPPSNGKDLLLTVTDQLSGYTRLIACRTKHGAKEITHLFFEEWVRFFGMPERLVSDRDKLFTSKFWRCLHVRLGTKLQMLTAFHPETDGRSERTNKTVIQVLRQYVSRQQKDWTTHLSTVELAINLAVNDSTSSSPFELVLGFQPSISPRPSSKSSGMPAGEWTIEMWEQRLKEARDALAAAKVRQAEQANRRRGDEPTFKKGDKVFIDSSDRRSRFKSRLQDTRAAKLFAQWDGPYEVEEAFPETSTYRLSLPASDKVDVAVTPRPRFLPHASADRRTSCNSLPMSLGSLSVFGTARSLSTTPEDAIADAVKLLALSLSSPSTMSSSTLTSTSGGSNPAVIDDSNLLSSAPRVAQLLSARSNQTSLPSDFATMRMLATSDDFARWFSVQAEGEALAVAAWSEMRRREQLEIQGRKWQEIGTTIAGAIGIGQCIQRLRKDASNSTQKERFELQIDAYVTCGQWRIHIRDDTKIGIANHDCMGKRKIYYTRILWMATLALLLDLDLDKMASY
ncbi:hypothetical protein JCM8115_002312, partial [Rhodotorula mucilaginosa]